MTVADAGHDAGHDAEHTAHVSHDPQLFPPFLALSSILLAVAVNYVQDQSTAALGFAIAGIYAVFLLAFFIKEALNKKVVPTLSYTFMSRSLFIWLFLASEIIFFGVIIGLSLILRINTQIMGGTWMDAETYNTITAPLSIYPTVFITFVLLMSSVTMMKAVESMEKSNTKGLRNWLGLTILFGLIFLVVKVWEYSTLFGEGFVISKSDFWTTFYLQTGFHTLHVAVGVMIIIGFFVKATFAKGEQAYTAENGHPVEIMAIYWHYVDIVWIFLMPLIYLLTP